MQYQTEAVLISVRDFADADKLVTLFSREFGKITACAYGARRSRSQLAGSMQLFTHLDVTMSSGKNLDTVKQCEVRNPFRYIREDLNCLAYGMFIAELIAELCPERQPEPRVFDLLVDALNIIVKKNPRIVALACAWQILEITGYLPDFNHCVTCGQVLAQTGFFSVKHGGCLCDECSETSLVECDEKVRYFIQCLLNLNWKDPAPFSVTGMVLLQTEKILINYLLHCLDKPLKSTDFIKKVTQLND